MSRKSRTSTPIPPSRQVEASKRPTRSPEERAHIARCMAEIRRHTQNAPSIAERLRHYRKWLDKGNTGTMADAAADYWNSPEDAKPMPTRAAEKPTHILPLNGPEREEALEKLER